jgi:hypothetical protein
VALIAVSVMAAAQPSEQARAQTLGGRQFKVTNIGGGSITASWTSGTGQTGYRLNRITSTGTVIVATPPGTATSFTDPLGSTTNFACYQLEILNDTTVLGRSDILCVIISVTGGAQAVSNVAIQTNETVFALITWQAPAATTPALVGYAVVPLGRTPLAPIPAGTTQAVDVPIGVTCYMVLTLIPGSAQVPFQIGGYSDIACAMTGQANLPVVNATPSPTRTATSTGITATPTRTVTPTGTAASVVPTGTATSVTPTLTTGIGATAR